MSKQSKHERIIREELASAKVDLDEAEARMSNAAADVRVFRARVDALELVLTRAEADKTGDGE